MGTSVVRMSAWAGAPFMSAKAPARWSGLGKPRPVVLCPWGSKSTSSTSFSIMAREAARLMAEVVLPTPPF